MRKYRQTEFPDVHNSECEIASRDELSAYIDKELPVGNAISSDDISKGVMFVLTIYSGCNAPTISFAVPEM